MLKMLNDKFFFKNQLKKQKKNQVNWDKPSNS